MRTRSRVSPRLGRKEGSLGEIALRATRRINMPIASAGGIVSVSIDTAPASNNSATSTDAIDSVVVELFDRFQKQRTAATWIIEDPNRHVLTDRIVRGGSHEVAYAGET